MKLLQTTTYPLEVQFEDVDAAGYVHHPKYLNFIERARVNDLNKINWGMERQLKQNVCFVVADLVLKYIKPAQMRDNLCVLTRTIAASRSSVKVLQSIVNHIPEEEYLIKFGSDIFEIPGTIFSAQARFVFIDMQTKKPIAILPDLRAALELI